ncbi:adhesion G protein-coupled receptor E2-like [Phascolarctos cinereus]
MAGSQGLPLWGGICFIYFLKIQISSSQDVYECQRPFPVNCGENAECVTKGGIYQCSCNPGYMLPSGEETFPNATMNNCQDVDECAPPISISCGQNAVCVNKKGTFHCSCNPGYALPSGEKTFRNAAMNNCQDVNECAPPIRTSCGQNADCVNTNGGYHCACHPGYLEALCVFGVKTGTSQSALHPEIACAAGTLVDKQTIPS